MRRRKAISSSSAASAKTKQNEAIAAMVGSKSPRRLDHICTGTGRMRAVLTNSETMSSSKETTMAKSGPGRGPKRGGRVLQPRIERAKRGTHGGDHVGGYEDNVADDKAGERAV